MVEAKFVRVEGVSGPCLLLWPHGEAPEELVVDFDRVGRHPEFDRRGKVTFRLQPSSAGDAEPSYVEIFDE